MKSVSARSSLVALVAITLTLPAFANKITSATSVPSCTNYSVTISGEFLRQASATVSYTITLTPTTGTAVIVSDSLTVTKTTGKDNNFSGTATQLWSKYSFTPGTDYTLTGTASLDTRTGNTVALVFSPTTISCGSIGSVREGNNPQ